MSVSSHFTRRVRVIVLASALATVWSSAAVLRAQGDRITLPRKPGPNQTLVVHLTQDMNMQMSMGGADVDAGGTPNAAATPQRMPPMKLTGSMTMEATQKVGAADDQGRTPCEFTYTDANMDMKMNGMSLPNQDFKNQFVGKSMTFSYTSDGTITDVKMPDTPGAQAIRTTVQQALGSFTMSLPTQPLSIGETAKMPVTVPLAIPLPGGATPPTFKGTVTYTLVRVDGAGNERVAVLDQRMDATAEGAIPGPGGAGSPGGQLTMHMTGSGQIQVDLARGVARSGEIETAMDGTIKRQAPAGDQQQPGQPSGDVRLQGTTKMKLSTTPQDR